MIHMRKFNEFEEQNIKFLTQKNIEYTLVQITETGFKKSILDATNRCDSISKTAACMITRNNCKGKTTKSYNRLQY